MHGYAKEITTIPLVAQMFVEIVAIDRPGRRKGRPLILAVCGIRSLNHRCGGTQGPDCKYVVGGMTTSQIKHRDRYISVHHILVEPLVVEEDMPAHMVVREGLDEGLCGGLVDSRENSGREERRGERRSAEERIQREMGLRATCGCSSPGRVIGQAVCGQGVWGKMGRVHSWTMEWPVGLWVVLTHGVDGKGV